MCYKEKQIQTYILGVHEDLHFISNIEIEKFNRARKEWCKEVIGFLPREVV